MGDASPLDDITIASIIEELQKLSDSDLSDARQRDSERLDNLIHRIIQATGNPEFRARLTSLYNEIHRVFEAARAASPDQETADTFDLVEGIVVVSSILDAIAEARIAAAQAPGDQPQDDLSAARQRDSERLDNLIHRIIQATANPEFRARLTSLDNEIHRVFGAARAASPDQETADTFDLVEGIVVVSSILDAIAERRIAAAAPLPPAPPKWEPAEYTKHFVREAIRKYQSEGLEATVEYYNTQESVDGQWYVFIFDENDMMLAHGANPAFVGLHASAVDGPNSFPAGDAVVAVADEDGAWFSYSFVSPTTGIVEKKHSWMVELDGLTFGSGWYERGVSRADVEGYTRDFVSRAIGLYNAVGREATVEYYNMPESVDGQWYVFIIDENGYTISHHNPILVGRDPSLRIDATGYFYGDDLRSATESGRWVDYVLLNPETGDERQKHTWAVLHDGLIFGSGWYENQ